MNFLLLSLMLISIINASEPLTKVLEERSSAFEGVRELYVSKAFAYCGMALCHGVQNVINMQTPNALKESIKDMDIDANKIISTMEKSEILPYDKSPLFTVNIPKSLNYYKAMGLTLRKDIDKFNSQLSERTKLIEKNNADYFMTLHEIDIVS
jgi:hypothetical protein